MNNFFLNKAELSGYKSIENTSIEFNNGLNLIIGKNAAGKTNFLNFLNKSLNFDFSNFNNFKVNFSIKKNGISYVFDFTKKTTIKLKKKDTNTFVSLKRLNPEFNGKLEIRGENTGINGVFEINNEEDISKFSDILENEPALFKSTLIRHGLPKNYLIIDKPLNIEIINKSISDDFFNYYNSSDQSKFFKKLLFSLINIDIIEGKYFNNKLRKRESIENFTRDKIKLYKNKISKDLSFLDDLKQVLQDNSPIENVRMNDNFLIEIDNEEKKISVKNFFLEYQIDERWHTFDDLSDGTKRIFYLISEIFTLDMNFEEKILNVIFIEEPELGIHPHQLYKLMRFIKEKSRTNQILVTTHSPLTLDVLEETELDSIIIAEIRDGVTNLKNLNNTKIEKAKAYMEELNLSDFWLNSDLED